MSARIALCLFDEQIDTFDLPSLMGGQALTKVKLHKSDPDTLLFLKNSNTTTPEWVEILQGFSDIKKDDTITASSGAILFLKVDKRIVACCFGSSVGNINRDNIVTDFGLAVAYRGISKNNYKAIETYTLTENPITNNRSAAIPATQNIFNLDTYLETITELSGKYYTSTKSVLIKGKEFFSIPAPLTLDQIRELCKKSIADYNLAIADPNYKKLTAVSKVKTKKLIEFLNDKLCEYLNKRADNVYLLDYQLLDNLESYSLTPKGKKVTEIDINDFYNDLNKGQKFTIEYQKTRRISTFDSGGQHIEDWSLYKCLFTEISLQIGGHVFYKGNWYEVQKRYLTELQSFISTYEVSPTSIGLPAWDGKTKERAYNEVAATTVGGQCWDRILYTHPDFSYGIEFCDVLLSDHVIHVKKLSGSSLNSHLLMQTYVSAQLLKTDTNIRKWIKTKSKVIFKKNIFLKPSNDFKQPPINYLIVLMSNTSGKSLAESLPFFSLITFNMMIRRITQLDYTVKICLV